MKPWMYWVGGLAVVGIGSYLIWGKKTDAAAADGTAPASGFGEYFGEPQPWAGAYHDGSFGSAPTRIL